MLSPFAASPDRSASALRAAGAYRRLLSAYPACEVCPSEVPYSCDKAALEASSGQGRTCVTMMLGDNLSGLEPLSAALCAVHAFMLAYTAYHHWLRPRCRNVFKSNVLSTMSLKTATNVRLAPCLLRTAARLGRDPSSARRSSPSSLC